MFFKLLVVVGSVPPSAWDDDDQIHNGKKLKQMVIVFKLLVVVGLAPPGAWDDNDLMITGAWNDYHLMMTGSTRCLG